VGTTTAALVYLTIHQLQLAFLPVAIQAFGNFRLPSDKRRHYFHEFFWNCIDCVVSLALEYVGAPIRQSACQSVDGLCVMACCFTSRQEQRGEP
jgi:hypothetical protein